MERPHRFSPDLALFFADSADVSERLGLLNQKLLAVLETMPNSSHVMQMVTENPKYLSGEQGFLKGAVDTHCYTQNDVNQHQGSSERNSLSKYLSGEDP